ncbi:response regulator transcription factor [Martelella sp. FOR1707]
MAEIAMMMDEARILELRARVARSDTTAELIVALGEITSTFGFNHFTLTDIPHSRDALLQSLIHFTSLPYPLIAAYDQAEILQNSAFVRSWRAATSPIEWDIDQFELEDTEAAFGQRLKTIHVRMGVVFTAPDCQPEPLAFLLFGDREPLGEAEKAALDRLAVAACRRFEQLRPVSAHHLKSLSSRELEVIKWTAEGKTSHEIGRILNLSDHTVNAYLANAIRKMECVNRAQLVAKAIRLKLIE